MFWLRSSISDHLPPEVSVCLIGTETALETRGRLRRVRIYLTSAGDTGLGRLMSGWSDRGMQCKGHPQLSVFAGKKNMRTTVIAELGSRLSSGSGRQKEGVWLFTALVLTAAIPVLLLGGWMAYITADQERSYARKAATEALTQVAHRIEGEISREMQVAETLASSAALDQGNLRDFYLEATRIVAARPLWETAALTKPDQEQVLNVLRPLGAPLGPVTDAESFNAVLRTRKPVLGGLGPYQAAIGKQLVSLRVPVIRDGELRYVLTIGLLPDQIGTILGQAGLPAGWAGTVIDAKEKIVARTPDTKIAKAGTTTPAVQEAMARGGSNSARTQTREGIDVETVHRVLAGTEGWSVHVGVPVSELNAPVSRSLRLLFGGTAASVGLAIALGLVIAREIAQRRRMEALQSAAALLDSEKRGALAIDAAELGTWRWDLSANEFSGCGRFCALLGLPGAPIGGNQMVGRPDFRDGRTTAPRCSGLVCRRLPRERQIEQRRVSGSVRRSRRVLAARGREGGGATQPASCDSRRVGRHRYSQARGDRTVSFASTAGFGPGRGAAPDFAGAARPDRADGDGVVSRPESARAGIGQRQQRRGGDRASAMAGTARRTDRPRHSSHGVGPAADGHR